MGGNEFTVGKVFTTDEWAGLASQLPLSPRQANLVRLLLEGAGDKRIAQGMDISVPTVRTYMSRLFRKLNVQDRHELVLCVFGQFRKECRGLGCPRCQ